MVGQWELLCWDLKNGDIVGVQIEGIKIEVELGNVGIDAVREL